MTNELSELGPAKLSGIPDQLSENVGHLVGLGMYVLICAWSELPSVGGGHWMSIGCPFAKALNTPLNPSDLLTLTVLVTTIDAQWEGMGDVGSARYEPALLPPCPTIRVLSYSN